MLTKRVVKPPKRFITEFETEFNSDTEETTPVIKKQAKISKNEDVPISTVESGMSTIFDLRENVLFLFYFFFHS